MCIVVLVQQLGRGCRAWDLVQAKYSTSHESFESFGFGVVTSGFGLCLHFSVFGLVTTVLGYAAFLGALIWVYNGFRHSQQPPPPLYGFGVGLCLHFFALGLSKIGLDFVCSYGMGVGMFIFLPLDFDSISRDWGFSNNVFSFQGWTCFLFGI